MVRIPTKRNGDPDEPRPRAARSKVEDRVIEAAVVTRAPANAVQRRHAGVVMASVALLDDVPAPDTPTWRRAQLLEVLRALGLVPARTRRQRVDNVGRATPQLAPEDIVTVPTQAPTGPRYAACRGERGTPRGYRRHLATYERPCEDCQAARRAELDARWSALGLTDASYVRLPE